MARLPRLHPQRASPPGTGGWKRLSLLFVGALVATVAVALTLRAAQEQIRHLGTAKSDAVQFSLAQFDVEFLRLRLALQAAVDAQEPDLERVRLTFDIFYNRVGTFTRGELYAPLRATPDIMSAYVDVTDFLAAAVDIVDSADPVLRRELGPIAAEAAALTEQVRRVTVGGLNVFSRIADQRREAAHDVLTLLAAVLVVLFGGLLAQVLWLARLLQTSRHRARQIADAGRRQEAIVATSTDGIVLADRAGRIVETNAAAAEMFERDGAALAGRSLLDLLASPPDEPDGRGTAFRFLAEGRRPDPLERRVELLARADSGRLFPVEVSVDRADMDACVLYVVFLRDISQRKAAEVALTVARDRAEAGERAKAQFLAMMSHEMRTPLNGLLGGVELLQGRDAPPEEAACLDMIRRSGTQLLDLVNDILNVSEIDSGEATIRRERADPGEVVAAAMDEAGAEARERGTELSWHWVGNSHRDLLLDTVRLRRILDNLIGNAVKFTSGGRVSVALEVDAGDDLEIRVSDTGIGIPAANLDRIFEDFETLDASYARRAGGTGLGLGICRRLAAAMGGDIAVRSAPGAGSTFILRLPAPAIRDEAEAAGPGAGQVPAPRNADVPEPPRPLSILVVDDNAVNRFILRGMLSKMGHRVTEATDAETGIAAVTERPFDLVMMDISMPDLDGMEATRRIRAGSPRGRDLPIVAVTAHARTAEFAQFEAAGMDAVVPKPIARAHLAATVARLAAGRPVLRG